MPPDPLRAGDARAWMVKANQDLRRAEVALTIGPPDLEDALFHSQQAVEKAIKAFLTWHDRPFRRTHNLDELGQQCVAIDGSLSEVVEQVSGLSGYAWVFRYLSGAPAPTGPEAEEVLALAREAVGKIRSRLPEEAQA